MEKNINIGDLVVSLAGRDKGKIFLVINVDDKSVFLINGKDRKISKPKRKNKKHIDRVLVAGEKELAIKIQKGEIVGNERIRRQIKAQIEKIQED